MAKDSTTKAIIQASAFYDHGLAAPKSPDNNPCGPPAKNFAWASNSSSVSSPSSTNSNGDHSAINFKTEYSNYAVINHGSGSLLSFEYPIWEDNMYSSSYDQNQMINSTTTTAAITTTTHGGGVHFEWLSDDHTINNGVQELGRQETIISKTSKRSSMGESVQAMKKLKKSESSTKDPQSMAAKNRRERISERLKVLQELVPNGSKVDMVTMLEKAISYVKFLQLQVKVLAADEFWPAQGRKAPDLSQVKEAIDAILATQRYRNSSSK